MKDFSGLIGLTFLAVLLAGCAKPSTEETRASAQSGAGAQSEPDATEAEATEQAWVFTSLTRACAGESVTGAAPYVVDESFHPLAWIREESIYTLDKYGFMPPERDFEFAPQTWRPRRLAEAQLVACAARQEPVDIEVCTYDGPSITRYKYQMKVQVFAALTGELIAENTFSGAEPRPCANTETESLTELYGERVDAAQVQAWLSELVGQPH